MFLVEVADRLLALKIAPVLSGLKARFEREIEALASCRHPAIAALEFSFVHVSHEREYWIIGEEFLPAGTLAERLGQGVLPPSDIRRLALPLADALQHLHERSLVHRDIKPANILFRSENEPVLSDFGIVRVLDQPSLTHDFVAQGPGTPYYAAPEQLLNEKAAIDWRTDQFGLALVLAESALGRHAFASRGATGRDAILSVANRSDLPSQTKEELTKMGLGNLLKALAPWPIQRYRAPKDFIDSFAKET